ncbi:hypothetical protein WAI453_008250 [Rhynchosporium graminicola]
MRQVVKSELEVFLVLGVSIGTMVCRKDESSLDADLTAMITYELLNVLEWHADMMQFELATAFRADFVVLIPFTSVQLHQRNSTALLQRPSDVPVS